MKHPLRFFSIFFLVTLMLSSCGLTSLSSVLSSKALPLPGKSETNSVAAAPVIESATSLAGFETALEDIYSQVSPSVVNIQVTQKQEVSTMSPGSQGFPFFFGLPAPNQQSPHQQSPHQQSPNQQLPQGQPQEF